jgi:hypothetical protein
MKARMVKAKDNHVIEVNFPNRAQMRTETLLPCQYLIYTKVLII